MSKKLSLFITSLLITSTMQAAGIFSLKEVSKLLDEKKYTKLMLSVKKKPVVNYKKVLRWTPKSPKLARVYIKLYFSNEINKKALTKAFKYYEKNTHRQKFSTGYLAIADYTKRASENRLKIIGLDSGRVYAYKVAHGKGSGPKGGRVYQASNRRNSHMTPLGFYKVGTKEGTTLKKHYKYLAIKGLDKSNKKVGVPSRYGGRDIVVHTAKYVASGGRSYGCFAIKPSDKYRVFSKLKGALLYSYVG